MEEFNLSEKYEYSEDRFRVYSEEDVKEFVRIDTEIIRDFKNGRITYSELLKLRKQLAGRKLTE